MEQAELKARFKELLTLNNPVEEIERLYTKAVQSGALYIAGEPVDNYRLCKIIYYAILCEMCEQWRPVDGQHRKEAKNLRLFI